MKSSAGLGLIRELFVVVNSYAIASTTRGRSNSMGLILDARSSFFWVRRVERHVPRLRCVEAAELHHDTARLYDDESNRVKH